VSVSFRRGLVAFAAAALPAFFYVQHMPSWALGAILGECLGAVHYVWVSATVRRGIQPARGADVAWFFMHSIARLVVAGLVFFLALKWPAVNIWSVLAGFSLVLLPASLLRLDRAMEEKNDERHS